jgi:hypothetical protein
MGLIPALLTSDTEKPMEILEPTVPVYAKGSQTK